MPGRRSAVLRKVVRSVAEGDPSAVTDRELLRRFARDNDQIAFEGNAEQDALFGAVLGAAGVTGAAPLYPPPHHCNVLGLTPLVESGRLVVSAEEHHELVGLVEARDGDGAEQLMRRHIGHVRGLWARSPTSPVSPVSPAPPVD